jgi:outer membrane biosynthesis protein TonB
MIRSAMLDVRSSRTLVLDDGDFIMFLRARFLLLIVSLGVVGLLATPLTAKNDADKIDQLIEQLGSGTFKDREAATKALDAIGAPALEKLRKAAEGEELEIKRRATELIKRIEKRAESGRVLQAKRVHLVYKDMPLKEAVADFKKKSGYDIALHDPDTKIADRKITLDTGDVTFWEAFDKFCDAAGVQQITQQDMMQMMMQEMRQRQDEIMRQRKPAPKQAPPVPAPKKEEEKPKKIEEKKDESKPEGAAKKVVPAPARAEEVVEVVAQVQAAGAAGPVQIQLQPAPPVGVARMGPMGMRGMPAISPDQIMLMDGKKKAMPTHYAGSVRIRAAEPMPIPADANSPIFVNLQVSTEPKTPLRMVSSFRISKAVDDNDQSLSQEETGNDPDNLVVGPGGAFPVARGIVVRGGGFGGMGMPSMGGPGTVTIPLKKGEKSSKSLKELAGTITLQVLDEAQELITLENVLKAGGPSAKGKSGGELKVVESSKLDNGQIKLQVELDMPPDVVPAGQRGGFGGGMMMATPAIRLNAVLPALPPPPPAKEKEAPAKAEKPAAKPPAEPAKPEVKAPPKDEKPKPSDEKPKEEAKAKPVAPPVAAVPAIAIAAPAVAGGAVNFQSAGHYAGDTFNGLKLLDEKGQSCPIAGVTAHAAAAAGGPVRVTYELTFAPKKDQAAPSKLVFSGSKTVTVEVPFTLRDVPLK